MPKRYLLRHRQGLRVWEGPDLHDQRVPLEVVPAALLTSEQQRREEVEAEREQWKRAANGDRDGVLTYEAHMHVLTALIAERQSAETRLREVEGALEPFAALADEVDRLRHGDEATCPHRLRAGDLRAARTALATEGDDG